MNPVSVNCIWKQKLDKREFTYETDCDMGFFLQDIEVQNLGFTFCPFCGKPLVVVIEKEPVEECLYDYE